MNERNLQDIASLSRTREIIKKYDLKLKKSLGQNFLTDANILQKIVEVAGLYQPANVLEIGPGIGTLTEQLARMAQQVLALEIDQRMLPVLKETLSPYPNVTVVNQDILKADLKQETIKAFKKYLPLKVVANLPYYVTTPILMRLIESELEIEQIVVMIQKEVAERISAKPGSKAYGSLSVAVQSFWEAHVAFTVPKAVFIPQPKVNSAVLSLARRETPAVLVAGEKAFFHLIKAAFAMRRKTLWNNLVHAYGKDQKTQDKLLKALENAKIDPKKRGETLTIQEFATLSNALAMEILRPF
ncbi:MAG: 16S rRNA (adenine(1518)-N(6)/adenine(1519)-N(6))-dimethyltransferase RsmA [Streptococcaceae bacterium]|jgi:16S rRNA (adenine1518-N6/adenine1519-N6)-dimethyltransferase|nr:16S rRNA (adenine(1518)-N(6)/adenine(1519)-N(6))-dimethyltransferase RsmA [Streptococcaceae bacterium]